jgi:hypothetical protein
VNYLKNNDSTRKEMLVGSLHGWKKTFRFQFNKKINSENKWIELAKKDSCDR